ncbi:MAG: transporter substrate-binding domain-containing protein [Alsobacter sp.]
MKQLSLRVDSGEKLRRGGAWRGDLALGLALLALALAAMLAPARAGGAPEVFIPGFWEPAQRLDKPDLGGLRVIRFLTDDDYPPMNFQTEEGRLAGFNVDLARALCDTLAIACTVQARRWDTMLDALREGRGDAVIASLRATPQLRSEFALSSVYLRTPARFVARGGEPVQPSPEALAGRRVGVVEGSAQEAYLRAFFPKAEPKPFRDLAMVREALLNKEVDLLFADGLTLAVWLNGSEAGECCAFVGGPYTESRYFGEGVAIVMRKGEPALRKALDYALQRVAEKGIYAELYLRYFPIGFY